MNKKTIISANTKQNIIRVTNDTTNYYANLSKQWATSENLVENEDYSAKYYAQKSAEEAENAKDWATKTDTAVEGSNYSAKYYAQKSAEEVENAKDWATKTDAAVEGNEYSAKYYAEQCTNIADSKADINFSNITDAAKAVILANSGSSSSGGGGSWGEITGNLSDQTDLNTALSNKADSDLSNCTKPHIIETYLPISQYRYRKWSDGWLEQTGQSTIVGGITTYVALPVPFKNNTYTCLVTFYCDNLTADSTEIIKLWPHDQAYDSFKCTNGSEVTGRLVWYVYGETNV